MVTAIQAWYDYSYTARSLWGRVYFYYICGLCADSASIETLADLK